MPNSKEASLLLFTNNNTVDVHLTSFTFGWPDTNGKLKTVNFKGEFTASELPGLPADPPTFGASVSGPHTVLQAHASDIDFQVSFSNKGTPPDTGYTLTANFDIGCTFNLSH